MKHTSDQFALSLYKPRPTSIFEHVYRPQSSYETEGKRWDALKAGAKACVSENQVRLAKEQTKQEYAKTNQNTATKQ